MTKSRIKYVVQAVGLPSKSWGRGITTGYKTLFPSLDFPGPFFKGINLYASQIVLLDDKKKPNLRTAQRITALHSKWPFEGKGVWVKSVDTLRGDISPQQKNKQKK